MQAVVGLTFYMRADRKGKQRCEAVGWEEVAFAACLVFHLHALLFKLSSRV